MLFPGDIISIKVKAGDGMKGGILGYITYVDEDKKTTKLTTNKEQWVCDKAVPGEEKKTDSSLIKEEGAQWIWDLPINRKLSVKFRYLVKEKRPPPLNQRLEGQHVEEEL